MHAVRILKVAATEPPLRTFERLRAETLPFLLGGTDPDSWTLMGSRPSALLVAHGDRIVAAEGRRIRRFEGDPFDALRAMLDARAVDYADSPVPFCGGAVGYFGYGLRRFIEDVPAATPDDLGLPDLYVAFYDRVLAVPPGSDRVLIVERQPRDKPAAVPEELLRTPDVSPPGFTRSAYLRAVARAKAYIAAGDLYEVNLSRRIVEPFDGDPWPAYAGLRAPYAAYLPLGEATLLSGSPELFLELRGRRVVTRPIKGTLARGDSPAREREALARSEKDHAELAMVVDLERNDLGRVCETGSVEVRDPWTVETHPTVHHLVATIEGRLRGDRIDLLRATFPGGSVTGCPKIRAMQIIDELEPVQRGPYTGAIGTLGFDGAMTLSVAIRIVVVRGGRAVIPVGGAIVADSDPEAEFEETEVKARAAREAACAAHPAQR